MNIENLSPSAVWAHFATLCKIPRASCHEAALIEHLIGWAAERGIAAAVDDAGNLILKKPASSGCEASPGVVLQAHLDMVCQANSGTVHDFLRDPIKAMIEDGWVVAPDTTLGADNGIGVALALAALEDESLTHPAIEVLLTVNEESGMDGARGLAPGTLHGKTLINLDTEEWGHFYLGCAGGVDVEVRHDCEAEAPPDGFEMVRLQVSGLKGGHSGIDIHLGRGNAIRLIAEALRDLLEHADLRLIELEGGTARNAIPREAYALCALPADIAANIDAWVRHRRDAWRTRFSDADAGVEFSCMHYDDLPGFCIARDDCDRMLAFVCNVVNGVSRVSEDFPGVTDTSSNLGVARLQARQFSATFKVRSLSDERADQLADKTVAYAASYGLNACKDGAYPGWTPDPASPLLALCQRVYQAEFGAPASLQVIHAGLECGLLAASHPHLDMISFGPDIRGAHAPGERVGIASVERCWRLLCAVLTELADAGSDRVRAAA